MQVIASISLSSPRKVLAISSASLLYWWDIVSYSTDLLELVSPIHALSLQKLPFAKSSWKKIITASIRHIVLKNMTKNSDISVPIIKRKRSVPSAFDKYCR